MAASFLYFDYVYRKRENQGIICLKTSLCIKVMYIIIYKIYKKVKLDVQKDWMIFSYDGLLLYHKNGRL